MTDQAHPPKDLFEFIRDKCEEDGHLVEVYVDHYQHFLAMNEEEMRELVRQLIFFMAGYINDPDQWKTEDVLLDRLRSTLMLIMRGVMFFPEDVGEPVFAKPSHMPTNDEIEQICARADSERETIREVLWEVLRKQAK